MLLLFVLESLKKEGQQKIYEKIVHIKLQGCVSKNFIKNQMTLSELKIREYKLH